MTLAVGMLCENGLILAADTRISYADGSVAETIKLKAFEAGTGVYAIVNSSYDAHAAESLIAELKAKMKGYPPDSLIAFVNATKEIMNNWCLAAHETRPAVQLLVGLFIQDRWGFYFCEPPNTVMFIRDKYKAIGDARIYIDPIYTTWFDNGPLVSPHAVLCQVSYMMYKAKQLHPGTVGGNTDVALLLRGSAVSYLINRSDMGSAEAHGKNLDGFMSRFTSILMQNHADGAEAISELGRGIFQHELDYGKFEFRFSFRIKP